MDLLSAGQRISFARVAREAGVSTWFVYNTPAIKSAIHNAMSDQAQHGREATAMPRPERATPASLHTDLALAREEIQELRRERDALKHRVQLALGAEIDNVAQADLVQRIQDLEQQNSDRHATFGRRPGRAPANSGRRPRHLRTQPCTATTIRTAHAASTAPDTAMLMTSPRVLLGRRSGRLTSCGRFGS